MPSIKHFTVEEAKEIGDTLKVDWDLYSLESFWKGMNVELEHGTMDAETNITDDDPITTAKIALAHLKESPDYYDRLEEVEQVAEGAGWELE